MPKESAQKNSLQPQDDAALIERKLLRIPTVQAKIAKQIEPLASQMGRLTKQQTDATLIEKQLQTQKANITAQLAKPQASGHKEPAQTSILPRWFFIITYFIASRYKKPAQTNNPQLQNLQNKAALIETNLLQAAIAQQRITQQIEELAKQMARLKERQTEVNLMEKQLQTQKTNITAQLAELQASRQKEPAASAITSPAGAASAGAATSSDAAQKDQAEVTRAPTPIAASIPTAGAAAASESVNKMGFFAGQAASEVVTLTSAQLQDELQTLQQLDKATQQAYFSFNCIFGRLYKEKSKGMSYTSSDCNSFKTRLRTQHYDIASTRQFINELDQALPKDLQTKDYYETKQALEKSLDNLDHFLQSAHGQELSEKLKTLRKEELNFNTNAKQLIEDLHTKLPNNEYFPSALTYPINIWRCQEYVPNLQKDFYAQNIVTKYSNPANDPGRFFACFSPALTEMQKEDIKSSIPFLNMQEAWKAIATCVNQNPWISTHYQKLNTDEHISATEEESVRYRAIAAEAAAHEAKFGDARILLGRERF